MCRKGFKRRGMSTYQFDPEGLAASDTFNELCVSMATELSELDMVRHFLRSLGLVASLRA
jgi:hypothetical protein